MLFSFPVVTEVRNFYEVFPMIPNHFLSISIYNSFRAIFSIQICTKINISQNIHVDYHINNPYFIPLTISAIHIHIYTTHVLLYSILEYYYSIFYVVYINHISHIWDVAKLRIRVHYIHQLYLSSCLLRSRLPSNAPFAPPIAFPTPPFYLPTSTPVSTSAFSTIQLISHAYCATTSNLLC